MVKEFRDFISRGNLVQIAVAFVMGAAFSGLVNTFITRIVNPIIGLIFSTSSLDNSMLFGKVDEATGLKAGSVGAFIGAIINFLIVALVMFLVVKAYNRMEKKEEAAPAAPPEDITLLREIRDSLKK